MPRVPKPTGSVFLHRDPTAGQGLRPLMDRIFGPRNVLSGTVWRRIPPWPRFAHPERMRRPRDAGICAWARPGSRERGRFTSALGTGCGCVRRWPNRPLASPYRARYGSRSDVVVADLCLRCKEVEVHGNAVTCPRCRAEKLRELIAGIRRGKTGGGGIRKRTVPRRRVMRSREVNR